MTRRKTTLYFAPVKPTESLHLSANALWVLLAGTTAKQEARACFERNWTRQISGLCAIATPSARSGLYALLEALNIANGDEVLATGFTCEAVPEPIQFRGAKPVYVDIDLRRFAMDPLAAATAITPRTKVIIIQHTFGIPAPVEALVDLAKRHSLYVIEDCALALGSRDNGRWLGTAGDAAIFSFELSKTLTVSWGGIVQINRDMELAERVRTIRDRSGVLGRFTASRRLFQGGLSGLLYRPEIARYSDKAIAILFLLGLFGRSATKGDGITPPPEYLAAPADAQWRVLSNQLGRIDLILEARRCTAARYQAVLDLHGCGVVVPPEMDGVCLIRFPLLVRDRKRFTQMFAKAGIEAGCWFSQPVSVSVGHEMSHYGYRPGSCPNAEFAAAHIVNLPLHERMSEQDVNVAVDCLDRYLCDYPDEREFVAGTLDTTPILKLFPRMHLNA